MPRNLKNSGQFVKGDNSGEENPAYRHGHSSRSGWSPTYRSWVMMRNRCMNPRATDWAYYGGRGITLCDEWLDFNNFLKDMGERPYLKHCIERIDTNGQYCKENCKWATRSEQAKNRRYCHIYEFQGKNRTIFEISKLLCVADGTLRSRLLKKKMTIDEAVEDLKCRKRRSS